MKTSKKPIGGRIKNITETKERTQEGLAEKMDINAIYLTQIFMNKTGTKRKARERANPKLLLCFSPTKHVSRQSH